MRVTIEKKTDQINFEDFLGGITRTITITGVKKGTREQQYDITIEGDERVWRPAVTMLKLLVEAWGDDATEWVGRRVTLYGDPEVSFGREKVGGVRVSHLSHIDAAVSANLTITRGKRALFKVQPLANTPQQPAEAPVTPPNEWRAHLAAIDTLDALNAFYQSDARLWWTDEVRDAFTARKKALTDG